MDSVTQLEELVLYSLGFFWYIPTPKRTRFEHTQTIKVVCLQPLLTGASAQGRWTCGDPPPHTSFTAQRLVHVEWQGVPAAVVLPVLQV
jgi:hypothetical protein